MYILSTYFSTLCAVAALLNLTAVVAQQPEWPQTRLYNKYGCVAYIFKDKYERLCDVDEGGKVIYAEQDGFFRITLFSEFPTSDGEPPILARPKYMQTYSWKTAGKTVDDRGMWVNAYNLCLARPGDDNQFHTIGQCPQTPYTNLWDTPHNPYRMKYDGKDSIPIGNSAASTPTFVNTDTASAGYLNLGTDPNLTPAGNSWEPIAFVDNANPGLNPNLNPTVPDSLGTAVNLDSQFNEIAFRRNRKNRRSLGSG